MMAIEGTHSTTPADLAQFVRQKTILLKTRKRDGAWVGTPVSIAMRGNCAYVRTYDKSWKSKRLRNFPDVRFSPSTLRGKPRGREFYAQARLLDGEEAQTAARLLARKYPVLHGILVPISHKVMRTKTLHYELTECHEIQATLDQTA
jgi:PPOX class probable F420-dependent enzyme